MSIIKCKSCGKILPSMVAYHIYPRREKAPKWRGRVGSDRKPPTSNSKPIISSETQRHNKIIKLRKAVKSLSSGSRPLRLS